MKYNKEKQICYSRRKGTSEWKLCKYPKWFHIHEYKIVDKKSIKKEDVTDNFVDRFAQLDRAV